MKAFWMLLPVLIAGCTIGTSFQRPEPDSLILGSTTLSDIEERMGVPSSKRIVTRNGFEMTHTVYAQASAYTGAAKEGIYAGRAMYFFFFEDRLVGYNFSSSYVKESTDFEMGGLACLEKGCSSREDVLNLLGPPPGKEVYPFVPKPGHEAWTYFFQDFNNKRPVQKLLRIVFTPEGRVDSIESSSSGMP